MGKLFFTTGSFVFWDENYNINEVITQMSQLCLPIDGVDISFSDVRDRSIDIDDYVASYLCRFEENVLHISFDDIDRRKSIDLLDFDKRIKRNYALSKRINASNLVLHPDFIPENPEAVWDVIFQYFHPKDVSIELMDPRKSFGGRIEDVLNLLTVHEELGFVPDTAHIQEWTHLYGWDDVYQNANLIERLKMSHVSNSDVADVDCNFAAFTGGNLKSTHVPCLCNTLAIPESVLELSRAAPIVLEGTIPKSPLGVELARLELAFVRGAISQEEAKEKLDSIRLI